jgi:D-alanyl-D-alanine carboxypeptidase
VTTAPSTTIAPSITAPPSTTTAPPTTVKVDPARRAMLSEILQQHRAAGDFVGATIALRDPDGTVTQVSTGTQSVAPGSPAVDPKVPWNIGSATKTFVAVVALQLAQEGRLDLDAGIQRYFPNLREANTITPRELLQHTSGLGEYLDKPAVRNDKQHQWTPAELIAVAEAGGRFGEPGGPHHYSNTNYIVLGEIIRKVTGHSWSDEVQTRIAVPLGLTHTKLITNEHPVGYVVDNGKFVDATHIADPSVGGAAGAMQSTAAELLKFTTALKDGTLLSPASRAAMMAWVPAEDYSAYGIDHGYGLGLERYALKDLTAIGHMGTGEAQSSYFGYDPKSGTEVAVVTNTATPGPQALMGVEALIGATGAA